MAVDQIRQLHESMPGKLDRARRSLGRALTLSDLFERADRVSINGLATLRPGRPVIVIGTPGGRTVTTHCNHTMTDEHIGWFRAASVLNALK